jgi:hypothetical protein
MAIIHNWNNSERLLPYIFSLFLELIQFSTICKVLSAEFICKKYKKYTQNSAYEHACINKKKYFLQYVHAGFNPIVYF